MAPRITMDKSLKAKIRAVLAGADVVKPKVESEEDETYEDSEYEIDEQEDETPDDGPGKVSEEADYAVMKMMINSKLKQKIQELKGKKSGS
jgi:hypothetical protein